MSDKNIAIAISGPRNGCVISSNGRFAKVMCNDLHQALSQELRDGDIQAPHFTYRLEHFYFNDEVNQAWVPNHWPESWVTNVIGLAVKSVTEIERLRARVAELEGTLRECGVQIRTLTADAGRLPDSLLIEISQALKGGA